MLRVTGPVSSKDLRPAKLTGAESSAAIIVRPEWILCMSRAHARLQ